MKRIWIRAAAAAALCAALLSSCTFGGESASEHVPADPLTGQELQYPGERTAAIVIDNAPGSTVQWGIGSASIVLEAQTAADAPTSLCLVYPAVSSMPTTGPVTLGQDLYWRLLSGQEVIPVQCGSNPFARNYLDYYNLRAVDALEVGRNAFSCGSSWSSAPLWYTSGRDVQRVLSSLSISSHLDESAASSAAADRSEENTTTRFLPALLPMKADSRLPEPGAEDAARVRVNFGAQSSTGFVYDAASGTYGMLHSDGTPQLDANTGTQAQFENLLILFSSSSLRDDERTLDYDLTLGGGIWLNSGCLWHITWTQGTDSTFALYDADGKPLNLRTGRSYLALVSSVTGEELSVQDSAGEELLVHTAS